MKPEVTFEMASELTEGTAHCYDEGGFMIAAIRVPQEPAPSGTKTVSLSPEDYGKLIRHVAESQRFTHSN